MAEVTFSGDDLMSQRLGLLRQLAESLEQAQSSLAAATPAKLDFHTARQRDLCRELHSLEPGFNEKGRVETDSWLADDLREAARQVANLNRKYAAQLRRRRRTVDIFCRVLASSGTTYPPPGAKE